jgi:hypothetical protein
VAPKATKEERGTRPQSQENQCEHEPIQLEKTEKLPQPIDIFSGTRYNVGYIGNLAMTGTVPIFGPTEREATAGSFLDGEIGKTTPEPLRVTTQPMLPVKEF